MNELFWIALLTPWLFFLVAMIPVAMTLLEGRRLDRLQREHKPAPDA
jgi:hypothetical protein